MINDFEIHITKDKIAKRTRIKTIMKPKSEASKSTEPVPGVGYESGEATEVELFSTLFGFNIFKTTNARNKTMQIQFRII